MKTVIFVIFCAFAALVAARIEVILPAAPALSLADLPAALERASAAVIDGDEISLLAPSGRAFARIFASPEATAAISAKIPLSAAGLTNAQFFTLAVLVVIGALLFARAFGAKIRGKQRPSSDESDEFVQKTEQILQHLGRLKKNTSARNFTDFAGGSDERGTADHPRTADSRTATAADGAEHPTTRFSDVLGAFAAKRELSRLAARHSADSPFSALLFYGASGVGKTMLARALAAECGCAFLYASASSFNELYVGMGAKRVRELFASARTRRPCVIFIDEIDALGSARGNLLNKESEHTLNELLVQMDGFASSRGLLLVAATNRADVLDPALLRRFSKRVEFALPNARERLDFARHFGLVPPLSEQKAAALTAGFSGADFAAVAQDIAAPDEGEILRAIAARRFGLAASEQFERSHAVSEAAVQTVAELLGAEVFCLAGRAIWQLLAEPSRSCALARAQILLAADAGTEALLGDVFAHNFARRKEAQNELAQYFFAPIPGVAAPGLAEALKSAQEAAAALIEANLDLVRARADLLLHEAEQAYAQMAEDER